MVKIKCQWCGEEGEYKVWYKLKNAGVVRRKVICNYCTRTIPSSIKIKTDDGKHYHKEYK